MNPVPRMRVKKGQGEFGGPYRYLSNRDRSSHFEINIVVHIELLPSGSRHIGLLEVDVRFIWIEGHVRVEGARLACLMV